MYWQLMGTSGLMKKVNIGGGKEDQKWGVCVHPTHEPPIPMALTDMG